jgi:hypothetical protein
MTMRRAWHGIPIDDDSSPIVRTSFNDDDAWVRLRRAVHTRGEFVAPVHFVDDRVFDGLDVPTLIAMASGGTEMPTFLLLADAAAMSSDEHPMLVVDLVDEPGRSFRIVASEVWGVTCNLPIGNMDWEDFAEAADPDGVFRGFPR